MKLIYPKEFKMNHKTLKTSIEYEFGIETGSIYIVGSKKNLEFAYELNPGRYNTSLHRIVKGKYTL